MKTYDHIRKKLNQDGDFFNAKIHRRYLPSIYVKDVLKGNIEKDLKPQPRSVGRHAGYFPALFRTSACRRALINVLRMYKLINNTRSSSRYKVVRNIYTEEVFAAFCSYFGIESMHLVPASAQRDKHSFLTEDELTTDRARQRENVDYFIKKWVVDHTKSPIYFVDGTIKNTSVGRGFIWCRQGELRHFEIIVKAYRRYGAYITAKYFSCLGDKAGVNVADLMTGFESEDMDLFDQACEKLNDRIRDTFSNNRPWDIVARTDKLLYDSDDCLRTSFFS